MWSKYQIYSSKNNKTMPTAAPKKIVALQLLQRNWIKFKWSSDFALAKCSAIKIQSAGWNMLLFIFASPCSLWIDQFGMIISPDPAVVSKFYHATDSNVWLVLHSPVGWDFVSGWSQVRATVDGRRAVTISYSRLDMYNLHLGDEWNGTLICILLITSIERSLYSSQTVGLLGWIGHHVSLPALCFFTLIIIYLDAHETHGG